MGVKPGSKLGPYEILSLAGKGGMGEVYRARDERLGRDVALKVLPEGLSEKPEGLKRFQQEAKSLAALSHPNILSIFDIGTDHGIPYVVMEYLHGETLRQNLGDGPLSWQKSILFSATIAEALAAAHSSGVVHRDLKPENIFITKDGRIKILDFGLARLLATNSNAEVASTVSVEKSVVGTVPYMSPEQVRGEIVDSRTDIFSFGCILFELVTGKGPFHGKTTPVTIAAILKEEVPRPSVIGVNIPIELEGIILRCLEKDRENRFQSAGDLAFALKAIAGSSTSDRVVSETLREPKSRSKVALLGVGLVLLVAVVVGWLFFQRQNSSNLMPGVPVKITSLAVLPLLNLSGDPEQDYLADGMTEQLIASVARLKALRVISRTSAMTYKNTKKTLPEISKELNVDAILEGSVLKSGDRIQFTVQLIHAPTDNHLWAETYQRNLEDILTVQNELAESIASEIQLQLTPQEQKQLAVRESVNPEAHIDYLKGRFYFAKFTEPDFKTAIEFFQSALQKDPAYAPAYAGIADVYVMMSDNFLPPSECMPKAKAAALKALELNPDLPEAHTSLGAVKFYYDWDWNGTSEELERALSLNPNYAEAHRIRAAYFASQKRNAESNREIVSAAKLDPLSFLINLDFAWTSFVLREYDLAIRYSNNALELIPSSQSPRATLVLAFIYKGDSQSAAREIDLTDKKALLEEGPSYAAMLASAEAVLGRKKDATEYLARLTEISKHRFICPYELAVTEYHLGNMDRVFPLLEHAYQHRSICMVWLRTDPRFDGLREDPRYQDLMKRVGI